MCRFELRNRYFAYGADDQVAEVWNGPDGGSIQVRVYGGAALYRNDFLTFGRTSGKLFGHFLMKPGFRMPIFGMKMEKSMELQQ